MSVTAAVELCVGSATLVAVTWTAWFVLSEDGAVYSPVLLSVPTCGLSDQVTPRLLVPETVAVNCCVCEACRVAVVGLTWIPTPEACLIWMAEIFGKSAGPVTNCMV